MKNRIPNMDGAAVLPEERGADEQTRPAARGHLKQATRTSFLSLGVGLALVLSGCVTGNLDGFSRNDAASLSAEANAALQGLYASSPAAVKLGQQARAILIFPDILKGGFVFGGQTGNGVLLRNGRTTGYYNTVAASYGLQAGIQRFGYALFLMNRAAMKHLHDTGGWEVGVGPSIVVVDEGMARSITTTTLHKDIYAFVFNQTGLMAGAGLQGSKISEIHP